MPPVNIRHFVRAAEPREWEFKSLQDFHVFFSRLFYGVLWTFN